VQRLTCVLLSVLLSACHSDPPGGLEIYQSYDRPATQPRDPSRVVVKVSLARQRAYVMEDGRALLVMPVTVGSPDTPTPQGAFRISRKDAKRRAPDYGFRRRGRRIERTYRDEVPDGWTFIGRPTPYWCEFAPGLGFHTGWIKHLPASDGCIRMHANVASKFFALVSVGTPVDIATTQPEDRHHAVIPLPPDAGPLPDFPAEHYLGSAEFSAPGPAGGGG
jgi:hypothetical protein